jgi:prevent-host-death family protein
METVGEIGHLMAIIARMRRNSVADAKNHLSELTNRSLAGESIVITRHGHPVVELKAVQPVGRRVTRKDLDWLAAQIVDASPTTDAGTLLSRMRDED